jgi:hypothetical protein
VLTRSSTAPGDPTLAPIKSEKLISKLAFINRAACAPLHLGVVKLENLLPNGSDVYDTPGLLQSFQVASRLNNEEARMVLPRARLKPRTYRAEIGSTIHIGGLAR